MESQSPLWNGWRRRKKENKLFLVLFSLLFVGEISAQAPKMVAGINVEKVKRAEKLVQNEMDKGNIPGAVTMIIHNRQVVQAAAWFRRCNRWPRKAISPVNTTVVYAKWSTRL